MRKTFLVLAWEFCEEDYFFTIFLVNCAFSRSKPKGQLISKIRKKVSFNLNVQTYEPISTDYHLLKDEESDAKICDDKESEEIALGSSNLNYRYQNCREFYDEEDDIAFEDSDLDDKDGDDGDEIIEDIRDGDINSQRESQEGFLKRVSSSVEEKRNVDRSECIHSVLKPVENLTQWRAAKVKAKDEAAAAAAAAKQRDQRKENVSLSREPKLAPQCCNQSKPLLQEIAVDSSLSTWLNSPSS